MMDAYISIGLSTLKFVSKSELSSQLETKLYILHQFENQEDFCSRIIGLIPDHIKKLLIVRSEIDTTQLVHKMLENGIQVTQQINYELLSRYLFKPPTISNLILDCGIRVRLILITNRTVVQKITIPTVRFDAVGDIDNKHWRLGDHKTKIIWQNYEEDVLRDINVAIGSCIDCLNYLTRKYLSQTITLVGGGTQQILKLQQTQNVIKEFDLRPLELSLDVQDTISLADDQIGCFWDVAIGMEMYK